jgi:hypothetical protein
MAWLRAACAPMRQSGPITTPEPMAAWGPIRQRAPTSAPASTSANGPTSAEGSTRARSWTDAVGCMPGARGASGWNRPATRAHPSYGFGVTIGTTPGGTRAIMSGWRITAPAEVASSAAA